MACDSFYQDRSLISCFFLGAAARFCLVSLKGNRRLKQVLGAKKLIQPVSKPMDTKPFPQVNNMMAGSKQFTKRCFH